MEQTVWYVCECGCRVTQDKMKKVKSGPSMVFRCAEHSSNVHHREANCQWPGCNEIFSQSKSGYMSQYCHPHRAANAAKARQEWRYDRLTAPDNPENKIKIKKYSMALDDPSRWACGHREDCLSEYRDYACLPCKNCERYQLQHGNADAWISRRDGVAA